MNNKKIAIVGVLAVIVTMMVGYALFSETVTINGTATAKGDFSITTSCSTGVSDNIKSLSSVSNYIQEKKEGGYDNDTCSVNGNKVSFSANFKYPGAMRFFTITLKNTGSITALLDDIISQSKYCTDEDGDDIAETCNSIDAGSMEGVAFIKEDGTIIDNDSDDSDEFYNTSSDYPALKPGQSMIMLGILGWDSRLSTEDFNNKFFKFEYNDTFNFKQYND